MPGPTPRATRPVRQVARALAVGAVFLVGLSASTGDAFTVLFYGTYALTGAVLIVLRPRNAIGWLLAVIAWGFIGTTTSPVLDVASLDAGRAPMPQAIAAWFNGWAAYVTFSAFMALAIVFPDGRLPRGRQRIVSVALLVTAVVVVALFAFAPRISVSPSGAGSVLVTNPFAIAPQAAAWSLLPIDLGVPIIVGLLIVALVGMVGRYRRATGTVRLQLRWLVAAIGFLVAAMITAFSILAIAGEDLGGLVWIPAILAYPMVPVAVTVAVLRYRLLEIDRLISRTISYALVTVTLFVVFALVNLVAQGVLGAFVRGNTAAVAISTLVVAALFNPLRVRLQHLIDGRFNRRRIDQERTIADFAAGLREDMDLDRLGDHIRATVRRTLEPRAVALWRRSTERVS